ncbi:MAG: hypothetical protein D9V47_06150 [Clostridia bacterium]|nr:MAG: hypothetical protein D9V47_06150 [Clostridia bacterium]
MIFAGLRTHLIVVFLAVTLAALLAGNFLYQRYYVQEPLKDQLLGIAGVKQVEISGDNVTITLGQVSDLGRTYPQLQTIASRQGLPVEITSTTDPLLEGAWDRVQYAIYEAASQGDFTVMAARVAQEMAAVGVKDYRLAVDDGFIFFQARHAAHNLYRIVPRRDAKGGAAGA